MKLRSPTILGLAFDDRSVACAQVHARGDRREQRRLGRFVYPADATPNGNPAACGAALKKFLDEHGFDARRAVVGVPAKWLIAAERELPPSDPDAALAILRMHGERMAFSGGELIVDVAGDPTRDTGRALLVGILKAQLDKLRTLVEAAGLELAAVTSTSLTVHAVSTAGDAPLVLVGESGTELVAGTPGAARLLRHVSTANPATESGANQLGSELRRTLTLSGQNAGGRVALWDGGRLGDAQRGVLADRAGVTLDRASPPDAPLAPDALNGAAEGLGAEAFVPAVALGFAAVSKHPLPVDFLDTRLKPPVERRFGRRTVWGVGIAVAAVAAFVLLYTTVNSREAEAATADRARNDAKPAVEANKAQIARITLGRTYYEKRDAPLGAMREVAMAFGYEEPVWASSLALTEKGECTLQGRTTDKRLAFEVRDRLAANPHIDHVQLTLSPGGAGTGGNRSGEQSFTIKFNYPEAIQAATRPATRATTR